MIEIVQRQVALAWLERTRVRVKGLDANRVQHIAGLVVKDAIAIPVNLQLDDWTMLLVGNRGDQVCAQCHDASLGCAGVNLNERDLVVALRHIGVDGDQIAD